MGQCQRRHATPPVRRLNTAAVPPRRPWTLQKAQQQQEQQAARASTELQPPSSSPPLDYDVMTQLPIHPETVLWLLHHSYRVRGA